MLNKTKDGVLYEEMLIYYANMHYACMHGIIICNYACMYPLSMLNDFWYKQ